MQITLLKLIVVITNVISIIIMEKSEWLSHMAEYLGSSDLSLGNIHRAQMLCAVNLNEFNNSDTTSATQAGLERSARQNY